MSDEIARLQHEQQYVNRVRARQEADGLYPPLSGMPGLEEWRNRILAACQCDDTDVCPVHAPHGRTRRGDAILDAVTEREYARERET